jgi:hypothetical protein
MLELSFLSQVGNSGSFQGHSIIYKKREPDRKDSPLQGPHMFSSQEENFNLESLEKIASFWVPACRK